MDLEGSRRASTEVKTKLTNKLTKKLEHLIDRKLDGVLLPYYDWVVKTCKLTTTYAAVTRNIAVSLVGLSMITGKGGTKYRLVHLLPH